MPVSVTAFGLLLSCMLCGPEKPTLAAKDFPISREDLRYDGKSFEQWRRELRTELKAERRVEGLHALRAFAAKGYAAEAVATAVETMKDYTPGESGEAEKVLMAADAIIFQAGATAHPVLLRALRGQNKNQRLFAVSRLVCHFPTESLAALKEALKDEDVEIRCAVLNAFGWEQFVDERIVQLVLGSLHDKEGTVRLLAVRRLGKVAESWRPVPVPTYPTPTQQRKVDEPLKRLLDGSKDFPGLVTALKDPSADVRLVAVEALGGFTRQSEKVAQAMKDACKDADAAVREAATKALSGSVSPFDPGSAPAVPPRR